MPFDFAQGERRICKMSASLLMIGAGNMGGAMLRRWLEAGRDPASVTVVSPSGRAMPDGVRVVSAIPEAADGTIVLGLKPQQLGSISGALSRLRPALLVSILAGVEEATLAAACPAGAIVRAMPNLPVGIGRGVTALSSTSADEAARAAAQTLMAPLGLVEWIDDERLFDAVTALSGCGPAFTFRFVDALARAAEALGLPAEQAARLALATVSGSAALAEASDVSPAVLADRVASPGGSTRAGLNVLDDGDALAELLARTLRAARDRNVAMAEEARR
jgi:pyrroline-5-carboxylate reductase